MIEKNKDSQTQSLGELQQELKSLKALLLSRGPATPGTPSSPMPILGRPTIPSWQLASTPATPSAPLVQANGSQESASSLDKGKGVDRSDTGDT
jgi:peroxin-14